MIEPAVKYHYNNPYLLLAGILLAAYPSVLTTKINADLP